MSFVTGWQAPAPRRLVVVCGSFSAPAAPTAPAVVRASSKNAACERGVAFDQGPSFYRPESIFSRDLAVLSACVLRQEWGGLSVLDLLAGSGVRGMRYLQQAGADLVWCNDVQPHSSLVANLSASVAAAHCDGQQGAGAGADPARAALPLLAQPAWEWRLAAAAGAQPPGGPPPAPGAGGGEHVVARVTQEDGARLLHWCALTRTFFDLIDIDSFGGDHFVGPALGALRYGGLLCLTSTAGPVAGGRDQLSALCLYGAHLSPVPHANEQGLRVLLGVACREALARGLRLTPLWSLYSPHGPVFRVMVRVERAASREEMLDMQGQYGFVLHDGASGESRVAPWGDLAAVAAAAAASRPGGAPGREPSLSGPLWVGPLHDAALLGRLAELAEQRGWAGRESCVDALPATKKGGGARSLGELLQLLQEESNAQLPPWYLLMNDIARHGRLRRPPARDRLVSALRARGAAACATHIDSQAIRTSASLAEAVDVCVEDLGIPRVAE